MTFKQIIQNDRESKNKFKFNGTFLDYLEIVKENPDLAKLAHKRMYDIIIQKGYQLLKPEENPRVRKIYGNEMIKSTIFQK